MKQEPTELATALANITVKPRGPKCQVGAIIERLKTDDPAAYAALVKLLGNDDMPAGSIADVLNAAGHQLRHYSVQRHRRRGTARGCACPA